MTRCTNRRTAILTLILGLTLLLCGCQVGGGVFVLPDISTKDSTQGKTQLLAALNKHYYTHFDNSDSSHFIYGNDSAAEAVLAYLQKVCADDASKVASLLSDSTGDTSPVHCADGKTDLTAIDIGRNIRQDEESPIFEQRLGSG